MIEYIRMVKQTKQWKLEWYKNTDENGGAMAEAIKTQQPGSIIIHSQTKKNGRLWVSIPPTTLLTMLSTNYGLYEVITQFPHKVYFDIDKKGPSNCEFLDHVKSIILNHFPNANMAISGSIKETKTSYHIVLQNYIICDEEQRQYMKHLVKYICEHEDDSFDWKVYTKNRNMKCINQSKDDGRVQEIIENPDYQTHCITCFINEPSLPFQMLPEEVKEDIMITKSKGTFDIGTLPKLSLILPESFDSVTATNEEILSLLPLNKSFNHDYTHLVARYCNSNNLTLQHFLSWLSRKHNPMTTEIIQKWTNHFSKIDRFPGVNRERIISILQHYYPHIKKDIHYRQFINTFTITEHIDYIETISQQCFNRNEKYSVFNVGMGGGKTAQTITYLQNSESFLWIAPNKALASNTKKRFENEGISLCHYEELNAKRKQCGEMKLKDKLIVCLNSIHYLGEKDYDVIVIDEVETLLDKFLGDFLEQGKLQLKQAVWDVFLRLLRHAKKVILLDAFITTKTLNFIRMVDPESTQIIFQRKDEPQTRKVKYMENNEAMLHDIIEKLRNGQKLFIFYPYKIANGKNLSMEQFTNVIEMATGTKGVFYNADVGDKVKCGLKDVNSTWTTPDFVVTNNIITCGVNYENADFDYTYLFVASHNTPRDIIQVSYRIRHLNSGIIKICYIGVMNQPSTWLNDCDKFKCRIYTNLYNNILIEKKAPIKRAIQFFCKKAHYKQQSDDYQLNIALEKEIDNLLKNQQLGFTYDKIEEITRKQAEAIEIKCFNQEATMYEKYMLNKYYFQLDFKHDSDVNTLAEIWDERYNFFLNV